MNREIEFRCWYDNQMHKIKMVDFNFKIINLNGADIINFEDGILMQYTGLKDKNGKKIFEGDIVRTKFFEKDIEAEVVFNDGTFLLCNSFLKDNHLFIFDDVEVIGTIFDKKEV